LVDRTGRYHVVFNGEIYNYIEIRRVLEHAGYCFRTQSDTEVLLCSYIEWGAGCLDRFCGMFAVAIWDDRDKVLFVARDRFGIKPLYYYVSREGIAFASEIKQLLKLPGCQAALNSSRTYDYL